jgi:biotin transport system substrate-specific component
LNLKNRKNLTVDIALISLFTAIICVCSWLSIPMGVPVSLQTFAVFTAAAVLGAKKSVISVIIYILLGLAGVPVFTGFRSGASVVAGPTGGYLIGFIFAALIVGILTNAFPHKKWVAPTAMIIGQLICYLCGTVWYEFIYLDSAVSLGESLMICVAPFILPDIIKITAEIILSKSVRRILKY